MHGGRTAFVFRSAGMLGTMPSRPSTSSVSRASRGSKISSAREDARVPNPKPGIWQVCTVRYFFVGFFFLPPAALFPPAADFFPPGGFFSGSFDAGFFFGGLDATAGVRGARDPFLGAGSAAFEAASVFSAPAARIRLTSGVCSASSGCEQGPSLRSLPQTAHSPMHSGRQSRRVGSLINTYSRSKGSRFRWASSPMDKSGSVAFWGGYTNRSSRWTDNGASKGLRQRAHSAGIWAEKSPCATIPCGVRFNRR